MLERGRERERKRERKQRKLGQKKRAGEFYICMGGFGNMIILTLRYNLWIGPLFGVLTLRDMLVLHK